MNYSWHPSFGDSEFCETSIILNKFVTNFNQKTSDYPRDYVTEEEQIRELIISNKYHPLHHSDYYGWILKTENDSWWLTSNEINLLKKYGWEITIRN